jgi:hypothetical protein
MRTIFSYLLRSVIALSLASSVTYAVNVPSGLWVGEVVLQKVNETVDGINAANQVVSPNPAVPTPVKSPAHMRILFHVNASGQVRLLKGIAIVNKSTNSTPVISLISDPNLYQQYGNSTGQRITAVAFDFGDNNAGQALNQIAAAAATAAATGGNVLAAANQAQFALTNPPPNSTAAYSNFVHSSAFLSSAALAATSATQSLVGSGSLTQAKKIIMANAAALKAMTDANIFAIADALTLNEILMTGQIAPSAALTGNIYLGADHPTNPFRHKWNPMHRHGYAITRALTINFDSASSSNALSVAGFGVDRITGTYREEISGLHKPLGPNQDIGLITEGTINLERVSLIDTLNQ